MKARTEIEAGVCGHTTKAEVDCNEDQEVTFAIESSCPNIGQLAEEIATAGPIDAYQEISPASESAVMSAARRTLKGCCAACVVPAGLFKAMQVAGGLALPKDIAIRLAKE